MPRPATERILAKVRPLTPSNEQRKQIARDLLDDVRRADRQLKAMAKTISAEVAASGTTLPEIHGVGDVLAAKIIGHAGVVTRFESKSHFASYTGTAPIEASSGDIRGHRLNRSGIASSTPPSTPPPSSRPATAGPAASTTTARSSS
jgi:transposase